MAELVAGLVAELVAGLVGALFGVVHSHATLMQSLCFRPPGRHLFVVTYKIMAPKDDVNMNQEDHFVRLDNEKTPKAITFLC